MPASLIFRLARTSRWAMVGSEDRKARAISRVVSPPRVRRVNATRDSMGRAGWQHVNIRRSRSSGIPPTSPFTVSFSSRFASRDSSSARTRVFSRWVRSRRIRSMALLRAVRVIHAPGFLGTPSASHLASATANASCTASSARSKSRRIRISVARARAPSSRKARSAASRVFSSAADEGAALTSSWLRLRELHEGPDFDHPATSRRDIRGGLDRLVQVVALHHVVAAQLLLGLDEGPVGGEALSLPNSYLSGRGRRLEGVAAAHPPLLLEPLPVVFVGLELAGLVTRRHVLPGLLVAVDQQQVPHGNSSFPAVPRWPAHHSDERCEGESTIVAGSLPEPRASFSGTSGSPSIPRSRHGSGAELRRGDPRREIRRAMGGGQALP